MKLNIGCGNDRRTGWVNIDFSPDSAADKVMAAENLDLPDGCAQEAEALHLVEHLGYFRTRYFLSECFRTLRPGGRLVIETPDIIKTCSAFSGAKGPEEREAQLGWIYGPETAGMGHRYAFPEELLKELARRAGFDVISTESRTYHPGRAALRFELRRHEEDRAAACQAALRKAVT
ncbi:MAG TPA: SAM-dependent methyltransferase, partial [Elusimicrobia bacterium]|nr:SAM-dependent methyltransferase [Elusimicrobiota bacterium]